MDVDPQLFKSSNGRGEMGMMNETGDTKTLWDAKNPDEVENARKQFEFLTKVKKFAAFKVAKNGDKTSEIIKEFDPELEKIIFVPALQGG